MDSPGSFSEWLRFFGVGRGNDYWRAPYWPPDVYAITAAFLRRTGVYIEFANHSRGDARPRGDPEAEDLGNTWRKHLQRDLDISKGPRGNDFNIPEKIGRWWTTFSAPGNSNVSFAEAAADPGIQEAAWNLCIVSDVACRGIGVRVSYLEEEEGEGKKGKDPFLALAQGVLTTNKGLSFCLEVPVDKIAVLGKQHTPQRGCTIRSLTHHLSYYVPSEIQASWSGPWAHAEDHDVLNLLLLPWPLEVEAGDFAMVEGGRRGAKHGYFEYRPQPKFAPQDLRARVEKAVNDARRHAQRIHGIVFPELALSQEEFAAIEALAIEQRMLLIAGLRMHVAGMPANTCVIQPHGLTAEPNTDPEKMRRIQLKHHRWCLDRDQILRYGLGGRITASRECWENIYLGPRKIHFVTLGSWLTIGVLICEDLARQDPISDVVRAVGPNLLFSLLMDGPQLRHRWPSRYASVLAEDPGCSVLTLTSLGMSRRSKPLEAPQGAPDRSRAIALWRDKWYGEREIELDPGDDACVLTLVSRSEQEYTLDGRHDAGQAHYPVFAGAYSFRTTPLDRA